MASAEYLEQVLSTNVDENAVNAIVGSLENQLVTSVSSVSSQNNIVNVIPSQASHASQNAGAVIGSQKYILDQLNCGGLVNSINQNFSSNSSVSYHNVHSSNPSFTSFPLMGGGPNSNETFKVIYSQAQHINNPSGVTFSAQSLPNNCIGHPQGQFFQAVTGGVLPQQGNKALNMQPQLVIKQGANTGQVGIQPGMVTVPMTVNSSMPASIPNVMTLNKPGGQNLVAAQNLGSAQPAVLPNVQILNMRPGTPAVAAQKSVATVSPRVVIGTPQVVGTRATAPITLQTLQSLQPGQQGHLLLKTENGQYQLLRVGPAPAPGPLTAPQAQAIRLSSVPAHPGVATVSTSMAPPGHIPGPMSATPMGAPVVVPQPTMQNVAPVMQAQQQIQTAPPAQIKPSDNTKEKCRNFLANLLDLSSKEPPSVERSVRNLIQELIDALVEPEEFCDRLERLLNASPQPCLIGFLKKSLPLLRQSLVTKELMIEGINPPAAHVAFANMAGLPPGPTLPSSSTVQILIDDDDDDDSNSSGNTTLTPLLPPVLPPMLPLNMPSPVHTSYAHTITQKPTQQKPGGIAVLQNIPVHTAPKVNMSKGNSGKTMTVNNKVNFPRANVGPTALSTVLTPGKPLLKDKEKKPTGFLLPFGDDKMAGDDDINDVAAMGGVNLAEESQRILGSTDMIGTQIRSCKDEYLVPLHLMQARIKAVAAKHNLQESPPEVAGLLSHAVQERLKTLIEKLIVIAQHRIDSTIKNDSRYEITQDVKGQIKFLEEIDRVDMKRREDSEREILMRAAKSRSKTEDPEQVKLKAKAKEMQRAELEEMRQREANLTALQAIGPRKKARLDGAGFSGDTAIASTSSAPSVSGLASRSAMPLRPRLKRINQRDMIFMLEQERDTAHSLLLYRSYLK